MPKKDQIIHQGHSDTYHLSGKRTPTIQQMIKQVKSQINSIGTQNIKGCWPRHKKGLFRGTRNIKRLQVPPQQDTINSIKTQGLEPIICKSGAMRLED